VYERWTDADEDEERLVAMQTTYIDISNTQYGCEVALKNNINGGSGGPI
jgi:hypothetical protein